MKNVILAIVILWISVPSVFAQKDKDAFNEDGISTHIDFGFDSNIVESYEHLFGLEIYTQAKNLSINYMGIDKNNKQKFTYLPNTKMALGLGFTYRYLALSATVNMFPINNEADLKTKSFDFQSQIAGQRFLSFITTQFYKGFYSNYSLYYTNNGHNYLRNDIGFTQLGLNNMYALNKKYSFRGSVLRFQRMRYSVGSPLIAIDANYFLKSGDDVFIPSQYRQGFEDFATDRYRIWNVGIGGGYAYTWIINKRLLFAGIFTAKLPLNIIKERYEDHSTSQKWESGLNANLWLRTSYERESWSISLHYIYNKMLVGNEIINTSLQGNYGMGRLVFSKRLGIKKPFKKVLKPVDAILDIPIKMIKSF